MASASASKNYIDDEVVSFFQEKLRCGVFHLDGINIDRKSDLVKCLRGYPDFVEFLKNLMFEEDDDMKAIEDFIAEEDASLADMIENIELAEMDESSGEEDEDSFVMMPSQAQQHPIHKNQSKAPARAPEVPARAPEVPARAPKDTARAPKDTARAPEVPARAPKDTARAPKDTARAPEVPGISLPRTEVPKGSWRERMAAKKPTEVEMPMAAAPRTSVQFSGQDFCKFYNGCTRKGCLHLHENNCPNWGNCSNKQCMSRHPETCRFGKKCRTPGCLRDHSGVEHSQ